MGSGAGVVVVEGLLRRIVLPLTLIAGEQELNDH